MRRLTVTRIAALVALTAGLLGARRRRARDRADPPFVEYTGTGRQQGFNGGDTGPFPATIRIECPGGTCFFARHS